MMNGSALLELIEDGGVAMYPLLLCSIVSVAVILERAWTLAQAARGAARLRRLVIDATRKGQAENALALSKLDASPFGGVCEAILRHESDETRRRAADRVHTTTARELRRHVWILGTIGSLAPFIGLFGTVVGIIRAFNNMAATGSGGFAVVAAGISEALIATAAGLIVGVLSIFAYNAYMVRIANLVAEWRDWTDELLLHLMESEPLDQEIPRAGRAR